MSCKIIHVKTKAGKVYIVRIPIKSEPELSFAESDALKSHPIKLNLGDAAPSKGFQLSFVGKVTADDSDDDMDANGQEDEDKEEPVPKLFFKRGDKPCSKDYVCAECKKHINHRLDGGHVASTPNSSWYVCTPCFNKPLARCHACTNRTARHYLRKCYLTGDAPENKFMMVEMCISCVTDSDYDLKRCDGPCGTYRESTIEVCESCYNEICSLD
jgi:hypothetical protein